MALPPCGLYRTTRAVADVPARRLVYFHNHGEVGPGIYLPSGWNLNRARFHSHGHTVDEAYASTLVPLPAEGLYRVLEPFTCCEKRCRAFEADLLVQLGYNGAAEPIVFVPEWTHAGLGFPERGFLLSPDHLRKLAPLRVAESPYEPTLVH